MKNLEKFSQVAPSRIKKIILIRNDKIGDMVVSSNVITALKTRFPDAKIDIVTSKENKALVEENKKINKIYVLNYSPRTPNEFSSYFKLSKQIKKEKYDLGVAIRGSFFNIFFLLFLGNVKYKIGFYTNKISKVFLNYAHLKDFKGHATHNMIKMLNGALGTNFKPLWPEIATSKKDGSDVNRFIKQNKIKKFISMVIDASDEKRQWPLRNFDQLIKHLNKEYPKHRLLLLSVDKKKMNFLLKRNPHCISLLRKNLRHIFLLFKKTDLVITPDGGLMHLAWASRANLIAFISPSVILEDTKPLGKKSKFIYKEMSNIKLDEVKKLISETLKK